MLKRVVDVVAALVALVLLLPVFCALVLIVRFNMGAPVFFRQARPGLQGQIFHMIKFRTMRDALDAQGNALPDALRLTRCGRLLCSTTLDEVPELWNVLKGDMSLVGPRPLLVEYLPLYSVEQARRHKARPGLSGWAQVNGRNTLSWEDRFRLDVWYVEHCSLWLDMKIIFLTLWKVVHREGISAKGEATMPA